LKIQSEKDFWSGLMFMVVGAAFAWGAAANYSFGSSARPGPAYFPFGLGVLLALIGAFILFQSIVIKTEDGDKIGTWGMKPLLWITLSVAMFGLILPHVGMVIALPLLVLVAAQAGDEFHWGEALFNAALLTVFSWLIFIVGLKLTIPLWPAFLVK
jgi:Tripartite tricarboxylate transporter TctB family